MFVYEIDDLIKLEDDDCISFTITWLYVFSILCYFFTFFAAYLSDLYSFFASQTSCPVANAADRIIAQALWTRITPANNASNFHFGTGYEFSTW